MVKKITALSTALFLLIGVITPLFCMPVYGAEVGVGVASKIASYFLGSIGAINIGTGGSVSKVGGSLFDAVKTKVADLMGTGIYIDSNGNYVFSEAATKDLYDALDSGNQYNVRVVSDFGGYSPIASLYFSGNPKIGEIQSYINEGRGWYDNYLMSLSISDDWNGNYTINFYVFDLTGVGYVIASNGGNNTLTFKNKNGNTIRPHCYYYRANFNGNGFTNFQKSDDITTNYDFLYVMNQKSSSFIFQIFYGYFNSLNDYSSSNYSFYNSFPCRGTNGGCLFWSNRSLIVADSVEAGLSEINKTSGLFVANTFTTLPSVSETVIENNDWDSIYNSYVYNIQNHADEYYDSENDTFDYDLLREVMKNFTDSITTAVDNGVDNIEEIVSYTNDWLNRIYAKLDDIYNVINSPSSGGGSSTDLTNIEASLSRIEGLISANTDQLEIIFTCLNNIYNALQNGGGGGGGSGGDWNKWVTIINNMPDNDVDDLVSKGDIIIGLLETVVPFCYLGMIGSMVNAFSASPETPVINVPIQVESLNIDEEMSLDFAYFDNIRGMVIALEVFLFIAVLAWFSFYILDLFLDIMP